MSIKSITADDLHRMEGKEALILQGCGGDLNEWVDGINDLFTKEGILLEGTKFQKAFSFRYEGHTCLLFPMDETVKLNIGKLALWRIGTHHVFSGKWLSDFVHNRLGGFARDQPEQQKPDCPLIGANGNIYNLLGIKMALPFWMWSLVNTGSWNICPILLNGSASRMQPKT